MGVFTVADLTQLSICLPGVRELTLSVFAEGEDAQVFHLDESFKVGDIFSVILIDVPDEFDYEYRIGGSAIEDPYAICLGHAIASHTAFGCCSLAHYQRLSPKDAGGLAHRTEDMILYRTHLSGFTRSRSAKVKNPGTFAGLEEKIPYLTELGISDLELLPVYDFDDSLLLGQNNETRRNYWGYSAKNHYFAPKPAYAASEYAASEFLHMTEALHKAGIGLILEFYFPKDADEEVILNALRHWAIFYGVDGFRLVGEKLPLRLLAKDPVLSRVKLFYESWDAEALYGRGRQTAADLKHAGPHEDGSLPEGYVPRGHLIAVPSGFASDMRRFLKADEGMTGTFAGWFTFHQDRQDFEHYITHTNGFTLQDLYSYDQKHNEANGEKNADGSEYNYSWNCGVEGPTTRRKVRELRLKMMKNAFLVNLCLPGIPMILAGDEFGQTQEGNNNPYCQNNSTTWLNWRLAEKNAEFLTYVKELIRIRRSHSILTHTDSFTGRDYKAVGCPDLSFHGESPWNPDYSRSSRELGVLFCGAYGRKEGKSIYLACNMHWEPHRFQLPENGIRWKPLLSTGSVTLLPAEQSPSAAGDLTAGVSSVTERADPKHQNTGAAVKTDPDAPAGNDKQAAHSASPEAASPAETHPGYLIEPRSIVIFEGTAG